MISENTPVIIQWHLHLNSSPAIVHRFLSTNAGRKKFWAESAIEAGGAIEFKFSNGESCRSPVIENAPPQRFAVEYFNGSRAIFELADDGRGGTDLTLTETNLPEEEKMANLTGWISVLLNLKAAVDFAIDLRNHDPQRTWDHGFVDN
jgi:hypothetical protein